jgi:hypothetical protein
MSSENEANTYHQSQREWEFLHRDAKEAVDFANALGIYACPIRHSGRIYWRPRLSNGHDPDLGWMLKAQPQYYGWKSWADAVNALGRHIKELEQQDD